MKKTKRVMKKVMAFVLLFTMIMSYVWPLEEVFADGTYDVTITFEVANTSDVTLVARGPLGDMPVGEHGDGIVAFRGDKQIIIDCIDTFNNTRFNNSVLDSVCESNKKCSIKVPVPNDHGVMVQVGGGSPIGFKLGTADYGMGNENLTSDTTITIVNNDNVNNNPNDPDNPGFDGKAYLIWSCKNGGTCYHYFENIPVTLEGGIFYKASDIKDDNTNEVFDTMAEIKGFALKDTFDTWVTKYKAYKNIDNIDWSKLDTSLIVGNTDMRQYEEDAIRDGKCTRENVVEEDFHHCVDNYVEEKGIFTMHADLQPLWEPSSDNAYVSYGDRNFKVTIYNDDYRAVTLGSLDDLSYYPATWNNPFLRVESYDISNTSKENPTEIETILLENTINIKALSEYNSFEIKSMEALDVPETAVTVNKVNGEFKIQFSSNFYDKVVFKVTDTNNKEYFIRINRISLSVNKRNLNNKEVLEGNFYFDRTTEYTDYIVTAKIVYKDGTNKIVEMVNAKEIDDGLGNKTYAYEADLENPEDGPSGKGLKMSTYRYELSDGEEKNISKVYFNVEYEGSTKDNYAGAFVGSGKGVVLDFEEER